MFRILSLFLILAASVCAAQGAPAGGNAVPTQADLHRLDEALRLREDRMHARMLADDSVRTMLAFTSDPQRRSELA